MGVRMYWYSRKHVEAARPVHLIILLILGGMGAILLVGGIYLASVNKMANTKFNLFGNEFTSSSVGVAVAFIGVVMLVLTIRRVLKSVDYLSALPSDSNHV